MSVSFVDETNKVWRIETEKTVFVMLYFCSSFRLCGLPCSFLVVVEWIPGAGYILTRKVTPTITEGVWLTDRHAVRQVPKGSGEQGEMEETGCEIICGASTTLAVNG